MRTGGLAAGTAPGTFEPLAFQDLPGWAEDDLAEAFAAFRLSAAGILENTPKTRRLGVRGEALIGPAERAMVLGAAASVRQARDFFEAEFRPFLVRPSEGGAFFTGYYEPEVVGSRQRSARFRVPLYARPADLVDVSEANRPKNLDPELRFARRVEGRIEPYPDRAAIEGGFLAGRGLELVWLEDPIDAFFIHIQGSARIALAEGGAMRVGFAGKSGHPYTPIGRILIEEGELQRGAVTMDTIRTWLTAHPERAANVMQRNRSFIFFREVAVSRPALGPVAAAGVQLTPGRSLAVDRELHTFHVPVWVETGLPAGGGAFRHLLIAQDTGSAIVGAARGDIFFGSGETAARVAGAMQSAGRFVTLLPPGAVGEASP